MVAGEGGRRVVQSPNSSDRNEPGVGRGGAGRVCVGGGVSAV